MKLCVFCRGMKFGSVFSRLRLLRLAVFFFVYSLTVFFCVCSQGVSDAHHMSYKRFRRRIIQRSSREGPAVSTPLATEWQCELSFEFDTVCQRLELDSPPSHREPVQTVLQGNPPGRILTHHITEDCRRLTCLWYCPLSSNLWSVNQRITQTSHFEWLWYFWEGWVGCLYANSILKPILNN